MGGAVGTDAARLQRPSLHDVRPASASLGRLGRPHGRGLGARGAATRDLAYPLPFAYLSSTCSPILWDNAPPNPFLPDLIRRWNETERGPRVRYATFDDLRERALGIPDEELPLLRGDWTDYWSFGYGSAPVATALNQRAKAVVDAASGLGAATSTVERATESIDLYDEHTFGYWDTAGEHPLTQTTEILKQAVAHDGHELATFAVMDALERLAGNPVADKGVKGVLLCNPGAHPITVYPELPEAWFPQTDVDESSVERSYQPCRMAHEGESADERTYRASRMAYDGRPRWDGSASDGSRVFGQVNLPPFSWRSVLLEELPAPPNSALIHRVDGAEVPRRELNRAVITNHVRRTGVIESSQYRLSYELTLDRSSPSSTAWQPRTARAEAGHRPFAVVRERTDGLTAGGRYAYYQRDLDREKIDLSCWQD